MGLDNSDNIEEVHFNPKTGEPYSKGRVKGERIMWQRYDGSRITIPLQINKEPEKNIPGKVGSFLRRILRIKS